MSLRVACYAMLLCFSLPALAGERVVEAPARLAAAEATTLLLLDQQATSGTPARRIPPPPLAADNGFHLSTAPSWLRAARAVYDVRGFEQLPARDFALAAATAIPDVPLSPYANSVPYRWDVRDHLGIEAPRHRRSALDAALTLRLDSSGDATPGVSGGIAGAIWRAAR